MEHGLRVTLAYDGTDFAGFQTQPNARTVQTVVERAIAEVTRHEVRIRGCSRTDAGVHAEAQIAAFTTSRLLPPRRWVLAINRYLPPDVAVRDAAVCAPDYEPRHDALDKTYRYLFYVGFARHPLHRTRAWHLGRDVHARDTDEDLPGLQANLRFDVMQRACERITGTHDFRAFRAADDTRENATRTLHSVKLVEDWGGERHLLALEVRGTAFMKNMVRVIAGTLVAMGRGQITPENLETLLSGSARRHPLSETAPGYGLTLVSVTLGRSRALASR